MEFYTRLGFSNSPLFTDNQQKCVVWSEQIYVMLISREQFIKWNTKSIPDTKIFSMANFSLPVESIDRVNEIVDSGLEAGGKEPVPMLDEGFMQLRRIEDPDGHTWGVMHLDVDKFRKKKQQTKRESN